MGTVLEMGPGEGAEMGPVVDGACGRGARSRMPGEAGAGCGARLPNSGGAERGAGTGTGPG